VFRRYDGLANAGVAPACLQAATRRTGVAPAFSLIGRLATYRYYNMDQVIAMALAEFDRLRTAHHHTTGRELDASDRMPRAA
jgi:hypothetical protein